MAKGRSKTERRAQLIDAAEHVFAERGVENTAVSDIVGAAGVAQGTFYLYFDSKDDVLVAVAERVVDRVIRGAEAELSRDAPATDQLRDFVGSLGDFEKDRSVMELAEVLHRPENRLLHDRLEERLVPRLVPLMERIVERGQAEGVFHVANSRAAAWFVLGGLRGAELAGISPTGMPAALKAATALALRALGYDEAAGERATPGDVSGDSVR